MKLKNDDILLLPKYFFSNNITESVYLVWNSVSLKSETIGIEIYKVLKIIWKRNICLKDLLINLKNLYNISELKITLEKLYKKGIIISSLNTSLYKYKEEIIIVWGDYLNYRENTSIVMNADKIISLQDSCEIKHISNDKLIKTPERDSNNEGDEKKWVNKIVNIIEENVCKGKNLVIISFQWHPLFWWWLPDILKTNNTNTLYIPSITYIGHLYNKTFMKSDPMSSWFISIDNEKILKMDTIDISFQIIITRIGYSKWVYYVYNNWKEVLFSELEELKWKLLEFYNENNTIFIVWPWFRRKEKLKDMKNAMDYWKPWETSLFIDSIN